MFGLFKRKTEKEKLNNVYRKLLKEAFLMSKVDRSESDRIYAEASKILKKINTLPDQ